MALATSYSVGATQGARENLENVLKTVDPTECPMFATLPQSAAPKATLNEWLVDSLGSITLNGEVDGVDYDLTNMSDLIASRARFGNRVQTFQDRFSVSKQAEMVDVAPGGSLFAASKSKALLRLRRNIESAIAGGNDQVTGSSTVGATLAGLGFWSDPDAVGATFDTTLKQGFRSVSGSRVAFANLTESTFRGMLQGVYTASGSKDSYKLFAGPEVMNAITDFTRAAVANSNRNFDQNVGDGSLSLSVVDYISDYGKVSVIPTLFGGRESSRAITGATNVNPIVITSNGHGLVNGNQVQISGVLGNTAANGLKTVTVVNANSFSIATAGNGAYTAATGVWVNSPNTDENTVNTNRAYLVPSDDTLSLKFLEGITVQDLPDNGAGKRAIAESMLTLRCSNPRSLGSIV